MLWLEAGWECGAVLIDKIIAVNRLCMEIIWKMWNMKQMLTFSMGCSSQISLALAPRNLKRVVATTAAADHWVCGSIQWQLPLPHFPRGYGKERRGGKCKLQHISMFIARLVKNFHTFDFVKDARWVAVAVLVVEIVVVVVTELSRVLSFKWQPHSQLLKHSCRFCGRCHISDINWKTHPQSTSTIHWNALLYCFYWFSTNI